MQYCKTLGKEYLRIFAKFARGGGSPGGGDMHGELKMAMTSLFVVFQNVTSGR